MRNSGKSTSFVTRYLTALAFAGLSLSTFGIGPRFHSKVGESSWFRPGVSYGRAVDDPMAPKGYDIAQLDVPFAF